MQIYLFPSHYIPKGRNIIQCHTSGRWKIYTFLGSRIGHKLSLWGQYKGISIKGCDVLYGHVTFILYPYRLFLLTYQKHNFILNIRTRNKKMIIMIRIWYLLSITTFIPLNADDFVCERNDVYNAHKCIGVLFTISSIKKTRYWGIHLSYIKWVLHYLRVAAGNANVCKSIKHHNNHTLYTNYNQYMMTFSVFITQFTYKSDLTMLAVNKIFLITKTNNTILQVTHVRKNITAKLGSQWCVRPAVEEL